jgi:hypothetical protein
MKEKVNKAESKIESLAKTQISKDEIIKNNLAVFAALLVVIRDSADRSEHPGEVFKSGEETLRKVFCKDSKPKNEKK